MNDHRRAQDLTAPFLWVKENREMKMNGTWRRRLLLLGLLLLLPVGSVEAEETELSNPKTQVAAEEKAEYHTVTFDGNGKAGTLWKLKVPDGKSVQDAINALRNPDKGWKKYYSETEIDGKHYRVMDYLLVKKRKKRDPSDLVILQSESEDFYLSDPVTEDMTVYAEWEERLESVSVTIEPPPCGLETDTPRVSDGWMWTDQVNRPEVTVKGKHCRLFGDDDIEPGAFWADGEKPYIGTMVGGTTYEAEVWIDVDRGYYVWEKTEYRIHGGAMKADHMTDGYIRILTTARHETEKKEAKPAGCSKKGRKAYYTCEGCKKMFRDRKAEKEIKDRADLVVPALGHEWGPWEVVREATATKDGEKVRSCKRDPSHVEKATIPAKGKQLDPQNPETGDDSGILPAWLLLIGSGSALGLIFFRRKRRASRR